MLALLPVCARSFSKPLKNSSGSLLVSLRDHLTRAAVLGRKVLELGQATKT
jgi:hypothetical protein